MDVSDSNKCSLTCTGIPAWKLEAILETGVQNINRITPWMHMLKSRQIIRCACPQGCRSMEIFDSGCVIMKMDSTIHDQGPDVLVKLFWPLQSGMKHEDSGLSNEIFNCIFCRAILMVSTNTTHADVLLVFLEFHCDFLLCRCHCLCCNL